MHDGAVHALGADNPLVAYTLLRSYAENAATVPYGKDHPGQLHRILGFGRSRPVKEGTITNYAEQGADRLECLAEQPIYFCRLY
ncbi:hypothetical protein MMEU_0694 [Mycobacterium marinum str. Europe]|nr:hypothetical protein MMEU_0694 [Mycobacterium marinum str. Europe]